MTTPNDWNPAYCDILSDPPCFEIDLLEGNAKAVQATLHTGEGHGSDGRTCSG